MSRGLGELQLKILESVVDCGSATLESLRWAVYPDIVGTGQRLPNSWNTSFTRAVDSLVARGKLVVEGRPLSTLEEWILHYPGKTLQGDVRSLRRDLIPELVGWIEGPGGPNPRYSSADNERFVLKQYDEPALMRLRGKWVSVEQQLKPLVATSNATEVLLLLVRGKQLFESLEVSSRYSLREIFGRCQSKGLLPQPLAMLINDFIEVFLPVEYASALTLKSYIHAIAHGVPRHGHCELGKEAIDALYERKRAYLEALPGFEPAGKKTTVAMIMYGDRPKHSPLLKKVIDQTVFHDFQFLKVA